MKLLVSISIAALVVLPTACAGAPNTVIAAAQAAGDTCRQLVSPISKEQQVRCASAEEWAELDRRAAAGVTCRAVSTVPAHCTTCSVERTQPQICLTEDQWAAYDPRENDRVVSLGFPN